MMNEKELAMVKEAAGTYLEKFGVWEAASRSFKKTGHIWCSEMELVRFNGGRPFLTSTLYDADLSGYTYKKEVDEAVKKVRDAGLFPYHVIKSHMDFGEVYTVLYLTVDEDGIYGEPDFLDKEYGYRVPTYAYNATDPIMSDYGEVCVKVHPASGGMLRTC
jgi:hypothetical protein